jgi:5-methylcytosine-specific restriction endonuclease McrA
MQSGKRTKEWLRVRKEWVKENPPDHEGYYVCGLCGLPVHYLEMEVDHVMGRRGALLVDKAHLQPTHGTCNHEKGSRKVEPKVSKAEYDLRRTLDL